MMCTGYAIYNGQGSARHRTKRQYLGVGCSRAESAESVGFRVLDWFEEPWHRAAREVEWRE